MKTIIDALNKPSSKSGPWAIWIWNQIISESELQAQFDSFVNKGFSGLAIRPGRDMNPAYMSEEFFELFLRLLTMAKAKGIGIRIADDHALPMNGFFEPIAQKNKNFRAQQLALEHAEILQDNTTFIKKGIDRNEHIVLAARLKNDRMVMQTIKQLFPIKDAQSVSFKASGGDWQVMVFKKSFVTEPDGHFIPNVFNKQSAQVYCTEILEKFWSRFSKFAPSTFEGIVTEVPAYLPAENTIPWDNDLPNKFRSKFRKDLIKILPVLFFEADDAAAMSRVEFYSFIMQSMYEHFAAVLESWARKHRLSQWVLVPERNALNTGNALRDCCALTPAPFGCVGAQGQDGIEDCYTIIRAVADTNALQFRRSTAAVIGRNRLCAGATLQSLKTEIDLHAMNGPARILVDGCFFNLDHRSHVRTPFNPSWYSPCWEQAGAMGAYAARLSGLIQATQFIRQAAIIFPSSSLMADYLPGNAEMTRRGLGLIQKTIAELQRLNIDYDILTEEYFSQCSIRSNGEFSAADRVRKGRYQVAIVPYCRLIRKNVLIHLEKLAAGKGVVIFIAEPPQGILEDGVSPAISARIEKFLTDRKDNVHVVAPKEMAPFLKHIDPPAKVSVGGKRCPEIFAASGSAAGCDIHLLHNMADRRDFFATIQVPAARHLFLADCLSGDLIELKTVKQEGKQASIDLSFAPRATYALIASSASVTQKKSQSGAPRTFLQVRNYRIVLKDQWAFTPDSLNVLPLANWNTRIGLSRESGGFSHYCEAYFEAREIPDVCIFVLCGIPAPGSVSESTGKTFEVAINGNIVDPFRPEFVDESQMAAAMPIMTFCGRQVTKYDVKNFIVKGFNRISIRTVNLTGDPKTIVYPPFVAGTFSVSRGARGWTIDKPFSTAGYDSWTKYGFPYLSGSGTYRQDFELPASFKRIVLKFSMTSGPVAIGLNQKNLGIHVWQPMEVDVTAACEQRRNSLEVRVMNTMDNLLRMNGRPSGLIGEVYLDVY